MTDLSDAPIPINFDRPQDVLSFLPYRFGYHLDDCLVLLSLVHRAGETRLGPVTKLPLFRLAELEAAVGRHSDSATSHGAPHLATVVVYSEALLASLIGTEGADAGEPRTTEVYAALARLYDDPSFSRERTYVVGRDAWRCFSCAHPGQCPETGRTVADLAGTTVAAGMVLKGHTIMSRQAKETLLPPPAVPGKGRGGGSLAHVAMRGRGRRGDDWSEEAILRWGQVLARLERPVGATTLTHLSLSLHWVGLRDNVIYSLCTEEQLRPVTDSQEHFTQMFHYAQVPDLERMNRVTTLLRRVTAACPAGYRAPALSVWAWCCWWAGRRAQTDILTDHALHEDGSYSLALILSNLVANAVQPPWTQNLSRSAPFR